MHIKILISACPSGTFSTNCSLICPDEYYGMFCKEKCDCKTSECDKAVGCPKHGKLNVNLKQIIVFKQYFRALRDTFYIIFTANTVFTFTFYLSPLQTGIYIHEINQFSMF